MSKVVEPPVLLSRALSFVLATSVVVLAALVITLVKMIPLERPEVFFLLTPTRVNDLTIVPMNPDNNKSTINFYKDGFIRAYVIARNTIENGPNAVVTRNNWQKVVLPWSSKEVVEQFRNTKLYKQYMLKEQPPAVSCSVYFSNKNTDPAITPMKNDWYNVKYNLVCKEISGQTTQYFYKIKIRIQSELEKSISGTLNNLERLRNNPLGIWVTDYIIEDDSGDPLNSDSETKI